MTERAAPLEVSVRPYAAADQARLIEIWHASKRDVYTFIPLEQTYTIENDTEFFRARIEPRCELFVAEVDAEIVGYMAMEGSYIDRLYVDPARQRSGIGARLIGEAKRRSPQGLQLHTHQKNERARCFYAKHEFVAVRFGVSPPPECEPDVEYHWRPK
ncbi:MAG: GNAT family N-acetyltransferase [Deltaproteobacteria bacterium]|nr:GNAT family N-acetyltransferase [Deltaproteobacteria bacterium]